MKQIVIACKTLERELFAAMSACDVYPPVLWLDAGLHNVPQKLRTAIQEHLNNIQDYDTVLLAMGFCGNSVIGLRTGGFRLVLPRCDDCISMLLEDRERPFATLFFTEGWLRSGRHLGCEYDSCLKKYGEERGMRIFDTMLKNYRQVAMLNTGCFDVSAAGEDVQAIAEKLRLAYVELQGGTGWLQDLLRGNWARERFLLLPPHSVCRPAAEPQGGGA